MIDANAMWMRHDLVWLSEAGWQSALEQSSDIESAACLRHWARERLPLVVGRQVMDGPDLALGLSAPVQWGRRKIALRVSRSSVVRRGRFPGALDVAQLLPVDAHNAWVRLCGELAQQAGDVRVHGSHGWQRLTGMQHLTATSDLDMLLSAPDAGAADAVASLLEAFIWTGPRIDGELLFADGSAVAWREWLQFRRGAVGHVLVKRLHGVNLDADLDWVQGNSVPALCA